MTRTRARTIVIAGLAGLLIAVVYLVHGSRHPVESSSTVTAKQSPKAPGQSAPATDATVSGEVLSAMRAGPPDASSAGKRPTNVLLSSERKFLAPGGALDAGAVGRSLRSDAFMRDLRALELEMTASSQATAMTSDYRAALQAHLGKLGVDARPEAFACGMSLCMGVMEAASDESWQEGWWNDLLENGAVPHSIAVRHEVTNGRGESEIRFVIVSDSVIDEIVVPPAPSAVPRR